VIVPVLLVELEVRGTDPLSVDHSCVLHGSGILLCRQTTRTDRISGCGGHVRIL